MKKLKIAIVWANPYNKNLGVGALAYSALSIINDVLIENNMDGEFTFVGSSYNTPDKLKIGAKEIAFNNMHGHNFLKFKLLVKLILLFKRYRTSALLGMDFIFDVAEGDSFTDIYGQERFERITNSKRFFNFLGKKQVLLPQTIGPFNDAKNEELAFGIMKKLNKVISRDQQSYNYTAKHLPKGKIAETIDLAFYMPFEKVAQTNGKINIGLNVSGLLWNGGYTRDNQFNLKSDYQLLVKELIEYFVGLENVVVHLVPHVIPEEFPVEDDYAVSEEISKNYPVVVAPRFESPIAAKGYISGLDFFAGARMHACIAAFSTGVPVVPMAYSRKFNGLFADTLQYKWIGDCVNQDSATIVETMKQAFNNRAALKDQIDSSLQKIVGPRLKLLKEIILTTIKN